ncbi:MAG: hypothetical protein C6W57_11555 [Caldibacillus debilis]|nr:MAG: hypothetical protein C6W57_11555 [Caldibacillus debilis]REJ29165.1 MAG: hypothetical protein C6W56_06420 [Caldibacillus debilis]
MGRQSMVRSSAARTDGPGLFQKTGGGQCLSEKRAPSRNLFPPRNGRSRMRKIFPGPAPSAGQKRV